MDYNEMLAAFFPAGKKPGENPSISAEVM